MNSAEEAEQKEVEIAQQGVWRCGICTYDNDESMNVCDICGAIRHDTVAGGNQTIINNNTGTVSSILKSILVNTLLFVLVREASCC